MSKITKKNKSVIRSLMSVTCSYVVEKGVKICNQKEVRSCKAVPLFSTNAVMHLIVAPCAANPSPKPTEQQCVLIIPPRFSKRYMCKICVNFQERMKQNVYIMVYKII